MQHAAVFQFDSRKSTTDYCNTAGIVGGCLYRITKHSTRGQMPVPVCSAVGEAMNRAHWNV